MTTLYFDVVLPVEEKRMFEFRCQHETMRYFYVDRGCEYYVGCSNYRFNMCFKYEVNTLMKFLPTSSHAIRIKRLAM